MKSLPSSQTMISAGVLAASVFLLMLQGSLSRDNPWILLVWGLLAVLYLFQVQWIGSNSAAKWWWWMGMALRLVAISYLPNLTDDYLRYLWDGRLTTAGYTPFGHLPGTLLDELSPAPGQQVVLVEKNFFTVYPPLSQVFFAIAWWIAPALSEAVVVLKIIWLLLEGVTLYLLPRILHQLKLPAHYALWYVFHPFVIIELVGNIHTEAGLAMGIALLVFGLAKHKTLWTAIGLGVAVGFKLWPILFLPFLFMHWQGREKWQFTGFAIAAILVPWFFFTPYEAYIHFIESLGLYLHYFEFNASIYFILKWLFVHTLDWPRQWAATVASGMFLVGFLLTFVQYVRQKIEVLPAITMVAALYFFTATTTHPWYIMPLVVLASFVRWKWLWVWSMVVMLTYYAYTKETWHVPTALLIVEYGLVLIWLLVERKKIGQGGII